MFKLFIHFCTHYNTNNYKPHFQNHQYNKEGHSEIANYNHAAKYPCLSYATIVKNSYNQFWTRIQTLLTSKHEGLRPQQKAHPSTRVHENPSVSFSVILFWALKFENK